MNKTVVVNMRKHEALITEAIAMHNYQRIDRKTKWGNPFLIGKHGSRQEVIALYKDYILHTPNLMESLPDLKGKVLGCWCVEEPIDYIRGDKYCHGEVLLELLAGLGE